MNPNKTVAFYTLGCKLNFSETSTISRNFENAGFKKVKFEEKADVYVINTCSVTEKADKRFKSIIKKALKTNDEAFLIAVGCYAQLKPSELVAVDGVDVVLGATEKFNITNYISDLTKNPVGEAYSCKISDARFYIDSYAVGDRTRGFLKVQDGCDYKCTYCTIPLARGLSRSGTLQNIIESAKEMSKKQIKEIVLTGVNIGDYGKGEFGDKNHRHTFLDLIKELDKINDVSRFRISSIEPNLLKDEIIEFVSNSNSFVPHFHVPLQSGSNEILKKMKRRYNLKTYTNRMLKIKSTMPNASIGVDVIVGFPGETDDMFLETYDYLNKLDVSYLHVFTYSERANTEASKMDGAISKNIRTKRSKMLRVLSAKKTRAFYESQIGSTHTVLFENENKKGYINGFTENYVKVKTPWNPKLSNTLLKVELTEIDEDGIVRVNFV